MDHQEKTTNYYFFSKFCLSFKKAVQHKNEPPNDTPLNIPLKNKDKIARSSAAEIAAAGAEITAILSNAGIRDMRLLKL